jgi:HEPN domain-containing protein
MTRDNIAQYWLDSADQDYQVMESLLSNGHYVWSLFVGHLVVEKLLKAYHIRKSELPLPHIHNLRRLAEGAGLQLKPEQCAFLDEVTAFNIRARYPDYKNRFSKTATKEFATRYIERIKEFRQWLLPLLTK